MKKEKIFKIFFCSIFLGMIIVPILFINLKDHTLSGTENRMLASYPELYLEDNTLNMNYFNEYETWLNDNIGFRSEMVLTNAKIQYYLFNKLDNDDYLLGPNGEFNYMTSDMLASYQRKEWYSQEELLSISTEMQNFNDYLKGKNIQLYYFQCWDKHSIYPEELPNYIIRNDTLEGYDSKTEQIINYLKNNTNVKIICSKQTLIEAKKSYEVYSSWGDTSHWTVRGSYIGYTLLMNAINESCYENNYRILDENCYDIGISDQGITLFGGIHHENMSEYMNVITPNAVLTNEKITLYAEDRRSAFFTNNNVGNSTRVLILGDSYIASYLLDDISESFYETVFIHADHSVDALEIIDAYSPDIVIMENAERCNRFNAFHIINLMLDEANIINPIDQVSWGVYIHGIFDNVLCYGYNYDYQLITEANISNCHVVDIPYGELDPDDNVVYLAFQNSEKQVIDYYWYNELDKESDWITFYGDHLQLDLDKLRNKTGKEIYYLSCTYGSDFDKYIRVRE